MLRRFGQCAQSTIRRGHLSLLAALCFFMGLPHDASAHHPDRECQPVTPRIDCIPPLGNSLPPGYRRRYNRPSYWMGRISYCIAPSSQEAMAWHKAQHRGDYDCNRGYVRPYYRYTKPWEALTVGVRKDRYRSTEDDEQARRSAKDPASLSDSGERETDDLETDDLDRDVMRLNDLTEPTTADPPVDPADADTEPADDSTPGRTPTIDDLPTILDADPAKSKPK
ncbi:MAG: hypothetical protein AAF958_05795 [Planctomycetota bacterium]